MPTLSGPEYLNGQFSVAADGTVSLTTPPLSTAGGTISPGPVVIGNPFTSPPPFSLVINRITSSQPAGSPGLLITGDNTIAPSFLSDGYSISPTIIGRYANGTGAAPTAVQVGAALLNLNGQGRGATAYSSTRAQISMIANQNWTDTAQATFLTFGTTSPNSVTLTQRMQIFQGVVIGNPAPDPGQGGLILNANAAAPAAPAAGTLLQVTAADGQPSKITVNSLAAAPAYEMRYAGGTLAAPSAPQGAAFLGAINQFAWNGSSYAVAGQIAVISTEAWTGTANGSAVLFSTVANGTTALTEWVRINSTGNVGIGTTAPANKLMVQSATQFDGITVRNATNFIASLAGSAAGTNDGGVLQLLNAGTPQVYLSATSNSYLNGGNVGIGTTTPGHKVDVFGDIFVSVPTNPSTIATATQLLVGEASHTPGYAMALGYVTLPQWCGVIQALDHGSAAPLLLNANGGNVGIGTAAPSGRLTVTGQGQGTPAINTASIGGSLLVDDIGAGVNFGGSIIFSANLGGWRFASIQGLATSGSANSTGHLSISTRRTPSDATLTQSVQIGDNGLTVNTSGSWATFSDASVKQDVQPYTRGLDAIVALKPVQFRYAAGTPFAEPDKPSRALFGLIADDVKPHVPEIVGMTTATIGKKEGVELSTLEPGNLIYALINAVRELNDQGKEMVARIAALESATVH